MQKLVNPNNLGKYGLASTTYGKLLQQVLNRTSKTVMSAPSDSKNVIAPFDESGYKGLMIDPAAYAKAAAAAKYDAQIGTLQKQAGRLPAATTANIGAIKAYYDQLMADHSKRSSAADAAYSAGGKELEDFTKGIIGAIGGSADAASPMVGAAGLNQVGLLKGLQGNLGGFNSNLADIFQLQKGQQALAEQHYGDKALQDLNDEIAALQGEKGDFYNSAFEDAKGKRFDQEQSIDNMRNSVAAQRFDELRGIRGDKISELAGLANMILGGSLADSNLINANLGNISTAQGINDNNTVAKIHDAQLAGLKSTKGFNFTNMDPGTRDKLSAEIIGAIVKNGKLTMAPNQVVQYLKDRLYTRDGFKAGTADDFIASIYKRAVSPNRITLYRQAHGLPTGAARYPAPVAYVPSPGATPPKKKKSSIVPKNATTVKRNGKKIPMGYGR